MNKDKFILFETAKATMDEKRAWLENSVAMGEVIRTVLKDQIEYLKAGIGVRWFNITRYKDQVRDWFEAIAKDLEWIFDTKMEAAKFRNSISIPKLILMNGRDEEQLEYLDKTMKRLIWKLEKIIEKIKGETSLAALSVGDVHIGDNVGRDKNTGKFRIDNSKGEKKNFLRWTLRIIGSVIAGLIVAWLLWIFKLR